MSKLIIFFSHITEEAKLADIIKRHIEKDFLGFIKVFVSSDKESILVGDKWLNDIDLALKEAKIEFILSSKYSVSRPWVNFEAGAAWVRGIPVIPICHTGMRPVDLPVPLNMLQGIIATDKDGLNAIYDRLAKLLESDMPRCDYEIIINEIKSFENEYGLLRIVVEAVRALIKLLPDFKQIFSPQPVSNSISGDIQDFILYEMKPHLEILQEKGMLSYSIGGNKIVFSNKSGGGNMIEVRLQVNDCYYKIVQQVIL